MVESYSEGSPQTGKAPVSSSAWSSRISASVTSDRRRR
jgi:hypothetical protein